MANINTLSNELKSKCLLHKISHNMFGRLCFRFQLSTTDICSGLCYMQNLNGAVASYIATVRRYALKPHFQIQSHFFILKQ